MNFAVDVQMKIKDIKLLKSGYNQTDYYLIAYNQDQIETITKSIDIIFSDAPFKISCESPIDRIEIWNYNRSSKVGSILLKNELKAKIYTSEFKR